MLTSRGWWLLVIALAQVVIGLILSERVGPLIALIGLVVLTWFAMEWALFQTRVSLAVPRLKVTRLLRSDGRETPIVWAGQPFEVIVDAVLSSRLSLPYLTLQDRPPSGCERLDGRDDLTISLQPNESISIRYSLRCDSPGEIRFEGVRLQLADIQGLFYHRAFLRQPAIYLVLPPLADAKGNRRTSKSHNVMPPPGLHRLRQAGGGSELHDLREYRPGDPPKMIAWKASARRDRLIIKEFESDVPVRCTLFVDASASVRIGPSRDTMLNQITTIASGVSQAALADRDHVGLVLFDDNSTELLAPARTSRHLIELLHRLARANSAAPISDAGDPEVLLQLATPLAHEIYPDLMDRRLNHIPFRMFWRSLFDFSRGWIAIVLLMPLLLTMILLGTAFISFMADDFDTLRGCFQTAFDAVRLFGSLPALLLVIVAPAALGGLYWLVFGLSGWFRPHYKPRRQRKQLSAMLAALEDAPMGAEARYLDDDRAFVERVQGFLAEHHRRYPVALFDDQGRYLFRSERKIELLSRALLHSVARGRDNELFVLMADLFELQDFIEPLLKAVRVACARHHQVLVISPWLAGIPVLDENLSQSERTKKIRAHGLDLGFRGIEAQLFRQTVDRYHSAFQKLRHEFGKSGVLVVRAQPGESIRLILNRMERLRGARARR